jgi:hypothetical protein
MDGIEEFPSSMYRLFAIFIAPGTIIRAPRF